MLGVDALLRAEGRFAVGGRSVPWLSLAALLALAGFLHGLVMGSFGLRLLQPVYSGLKVPLLLVVSTLVCLPSFFSINTVLGLRDDFAAACRGVLAAQATVSVSLAALSPLILVVYASTQHYRTAIVMNGVIFAVATAAGQITLGRHYEALIARNPLHRAGLLAWVVLYVFVAIQAAWVLRPFVGSPGLPSQFLREDPWSNAYVVVVADVWKTLRNLVGR